MRTAVYEVAGNKYMVVFNNAVLMAAEAKKINITRLSDSETPITDILTLLALMIDAGSAYARLVLHEEWPVISLGDLSMLTTGDDYPQIIDICTKVMQGERTADAEPPKNAAAIRE